MTVMFRKADILAVGGYYDLKNSQDYHLWGRLLGAGYKLANLPCFLVLAQSDLALLARRGGLKFIGIETRLQRDFVRSGFIGYRHAFLNMVLRLPVRLVPNFARKLMYRLFFRNGKYSA